MNNKIYRNANAIKRVLQEEKNQDILKKILEEILHMKIDSIKKEKEGENCILYLKLKEKYKLYETEFEEAKLTLKFSLPYTENVINRHIKEHFFNYRNHAYYDYFQKILFLQLDFIWDLPEIDTDFITELTFREKKTKQLYKKNFFIYQINMDKFMAYWYTQKEEKIEEYKYTIMLGLGKRDLEKLSKKNKTIEKYYKSFQELE